jgi:Cu(I)/Ag(I) efflux system membrane protein CusA/SilA
MVIARVLGWSSRHPWLVLVWAVLLAMAGEGARRSLTRDAIPDLSDARIVLGVDWMGHSASEVAGQVTGVLTKALAGLPHATAVRGTSMTGMAYVDVVFDSSESLGAGREAIVARLDGERARLPEGARVQVGPLASSTGWVFEYALVDPRRKQSAVALRRLQEDVLKPALASVPGVAEVATVGEGVEQVLVELEADRARERGVALSDVIAAVRAALKGNSSVGPHDLEGLQLPGREETRVGDVGHVRLTEDMPTGVADYRGVQPAIGGIVIARRDADVATLLAAVKRVVARERTRLPSGVELVVGNDRSTLIDGVWSALLRSLGEEVGVVAAVGLVFLLSGRAGLVTLITLPFALLCTFAAMRVAGLQANILSLGGVGIALGMAVDADVVALEACHRRLEVLGPAASPPKRTEALLSAAGQVVPAIVVSLLIAALTFLPVLAFAGEAGRLLRPLVVAKTFVLGSAALTTLTLAPALRRLLLRGPATPELANPLVSWMIRAYRPFVHFVLQRPWLTLATAALAVLSCVPVAVRLGGDFLPRIDEGDLLFMPTTLPGIPASVAATDLFQQDRALRAFPEVSSVLGKAGRADTATDPAPFSMAETVLSLTPRSEWPMVPRTRWYSRWSPGWLRGALGIVWPEATRETESELLARLDRAVRLPGWVSAWTAPARARMDMMATGIRTPVGVRVVAPHPARLEAVSTQVRAVLLRVPGTRSVVLETLGGEPRLAFAPDVAALAALEVDPDLARATADLVIAGGQVGDVQTDGRRMRVRVAPDVAMPAMTP